MPTLQVKTLILVGYSSALLSLVTWAWWISSTKSKCVDFEITSSVVYELLDLRSENAPPQMVVVHINPDCPYCFLLLKELSKIKTGFKIYLVTYRSYLEATRFVNQFPWHLKGPEVIKTTKQIIEKTFCASYTPSILVFSNDSLIYSKQGLSKTHELQHVIGNQ